MTETIIKDKSSLSSDSTVLHHLVREPQVTTAKKKAIVLLHGVGSNEQDLFSLADQLPKDFYIISPRGQFAISPGRFAWYNVDFSTGIPVYNTEQEESSRKGLITFIDQMKSRYMLDEIYLGGFSQGAIMSLSVGLTNPKEVQGIIALNGRLLNEIKTIVKKDAYLLKLKMFIAHGLYDNTLPVDYAREAKKYIEDSGILLNYHEYPTGHQISREVLQDLNEWLK